MKGLISAIIYRALVDWNTRREDVRSFFNSEWGEFLCGALNLTAKDILRRLEDGRINVKFEEEL